MATLQLRFNDEVISEIPVKQGDMLIGRQSDSDVLIDNLAVSGRHANIFTVGEDSFIQDLNSTNGTFINGRRVPKAHLRSGDLIGIGKHTLVYVNELDAVSRDVAKTVVLRPAQLEAIKAAAIERAVEPVPPARFTPPAPAARAAPAASAPAPSTARPGGSLCVLSGNNSGRRIELTKPVINLGRGGRKAGVISRDPDGVYTLVPGDGGEPPKLNGAAVPAEGQELRNGDVIEIAGSRMQFHLR